MSSVGSFVGRHILESGGYLHGNISAFFSVPAGATSDSIRLTAHATSGTVDYTGTCVDQNASTDATRIGIWDQGRGMWLTGGEAYNGTEITTEHAMVASSAGLNGKILVSLRSTEFESPGRCTYVDIESLTVELL